jgi:hypothetical protein
MLVLAARDQPEAVPDLLTSILRLDRATQATILTARNEQGDNALMIAVQYHPEAVSDLLESILRIDLATQTTIFAAQNANGYNALMIAAHFQPNLVLILLSIVLKLPREHQNTLYQNPSWKQFVSLLTDGKHETQKFQLFQARVLKVQGLQSVSGLSLGEAQKFLTSCSDLCRLAYFGARLAHLSSETHRSSDEIKDIQAAMKALFSIKLHSDLSPDLSLAFSCMISLPSLKSAHVWQTLTPEEQVQLYLAKAKRASTLVEFETLEAEFEDFEETLNRALKILCLTGKLEALQALKHIQQSSYLRLAMSLFSRRNSLPFLAAKIASVEANIRAASSPAPSSLAMYDAAGVQKKPPVVNLEM